MPSSLHEVLVELFRDWPTLAARLVGSLLPEALPAHTEARVESADLTEVQPAEYRADLVVVLRDGARSVAAIVVEVQLGRDAAKRRGARPPAPSLSGVCPRAGSRGVGGTLGGPAD